MKRIMAIVGIMMISFLLTGYQINQINVAKEDVWVTTLLLKSDVSVGTRLEEKHLTMGLIHKEQLIQGSFTDKSTVLGQTLIVSLPKNTVLTKAMIKEQSYHEPESGHSITTIKLTPDASLCWQFSDGEWVEVLSVNLEGKITSLGKVMIKETFDQNVEHTGVPVFVIIEAKHAVVEKIISHRASERLELIKKND